MKKLINLLNEYETTLDPNVQIEWTENGVKATPLIIISKGYGFIKWLVENDKIDTRNLPPIKIAYDSPRYIQDDEEILLMLLSISNSPIEDLVSYLK